MVNGFHDKRYETAFFWQSPVAIAYVSGDGKFIYANDVFCELVGYSYSELLLRDFQSITHPDDVAGDIAMVSECLQGNRRTYTIEKRYLPKQGENKGEPIWVKLYVRAVYDENNRFEVFIVHAVPLPNGGKYKIQIGSNGKMVVSPANTLWDIVKKDWLKLLALFVFIVLMLADKIVENVDKVVKLLK